MQIVGDDMGVEVIVAAVTGGLALGQAVAGMSAAQKQAKATAAEGTLVAKNKALEVQRKAAAAQSSFLTSGLTLEGTPELSINSIFKTGIEDIGAIKTNYDAKAKSIITNARTKALTDLGMTAASMYTGGGFGGGGASVQSVSVPSPQTFGP